MAKATGLGRGLSTLIPQNFDESILLEEGERVQKVSTLDIYPNAHQPRTHFDEEALQNLADSIKTHGILQPLVVTPGKEGKYMLIAGERRWRASKMAGLNSVPAIVRTTQDINQLELAIIENIQREDLSPLDQAASIARLHDQFNLSFEEIGKRLGRARTTVENTSRLLDLPAEAKEALRTGKITEGHARAMLGLRSQPDKQAEALKLTLKNGWSVRQVEQFVTASKKGGKTVAEATKLTKSTTPQTVKLSKYLGTEVKLHNMAPGGRIMIRFKSEDDLERIINKILKD